MRYIVYHDPCLDGWGSAFIAFKALTSKGFDCSLVPAKYGDAPPEVTLNDIVYVLDFSYAPKVMQDLANRAGSVVWLDHHKTAIEAWFKYVQDDAGFCLDNQAFEKVLDQTRSGVGITWDYFHPGEPMPYWAVAVQDRDLWQFQYRSSKAVCSYLSTLRKGDIDLWEKMANSDFAQIVELGEVILLSHNKIVQDICNEGAIRISICGQEGLAANCTGQYASDVGHELCKRSGQFGATWFQAADGRIKFSLRSEDDKVDVSELAKKYGGGGHRNAAGFTIPMNKLCLSYDQSVPQFLYIDHD